MKKIRINTYLLLKKRIHLFFFNAEIFMVLVMTGVGV